MTNRLVQLLEWYNMCDWVNKKTYSGFGGSLASKVPSFLVLSFGSSGSLSESELSMGSNGLIGWLLLVFGVLEADTGTPICGAAPRLFLGGASGCAGCGCWEMPNSFSCAASMSKSYVRARGWRVEERTRESHLSGRSNKNAHLNRKLKVIFGSLLVGESWINLGLIWRKTQNTNFVGF